MIEAQRVIRYQLDRRFPGCLEVKGGRIRCAIARGLIRLALKVARVSHFELNLIRRESFR